MDGEIHRKRSETLDGLDPGHTWEKLVRYQTIIATGGYIGLRAKELLHLNWFDIIDKTQHQVFQFKTSTKRKVYFAPSYIKIADRNFKLIDPDNIHHLIIHRQDNPMEAISTNQFNTAFRMYLKKFNVDTPTPSSHTLRKTYMNHFWQLAGGTEEAYITLARDMNYKSIQQVKDYLGHTRRKIKETIVKFK